jgi:pimeloyl-ACP methyl ester carboxylesterase
VELMLCRYRLFLFSKLPSMKSLIKVPVLIIIGITSLFSFACKKNPMNPSLTEKQVDFVTHKLTAYSIIKNSKYLIVFETGLGDAAGVWNEKEIPVQISATTDVLIYDRAAYGKSQKGPAARNISKLSNELDKIITEFANGRKVILVAHSLGGMIIRDWAIKNPLKTAALLFVDPSHELYNRPTQAEEDFIYNTFNTAYGANFGGTMEARELIEDGQYMQTLANLPNVPVIVLTSMKTDATHTATDRQNWFNAHDALKAGVTDFTHITTTISGHYIMRDEPAMVKDKIGLLISKLP